MLGLVNWQLMFPQCKNNTAECPAETVVAALDAFFTYPVLLRILLTPSSFNSNFLGRTKTKRLALWFRIKFFLVAVVSILSSGCGLDI